MIVVDNSILIETLVGRGARGHAARRRLSRGHLTAPALIDVEAVNTLRGLASGGKVSEDRAQIAVDALQILPMERVDHAPFVARMWELRHNVSAYDASYIALAEALNAPLLTGDGRLANAPGVRCVIEVLR